MNRFVLFFTLFACQYISAQSTSTISGIVVYNTQPVERAEIVNLNQKKHLTTNQSGKFTIKVNLNDTLLVYAKNFDLQKIIIDSKHLNSTNLEVNLDLKTDQLEEIVIIKDIGGRWSLKQVQEMIDRKYVDDFQTSPKNRLIYDGTIENGMDINRIGGELLKRLFKQKKKSPEISFSTFAITTCDKNYFKEKLKMNNEEIPYFLEYCTKDPQTKIVIQKNNVFDLMDFLARKNKEYSKPNEE